MLIKFFKKNNLVILLKNWSLNILALIIAFFLVVNNFKIAIRKSKEKGINTTKFLVQKNLQTLFYLDPVSYVEKIFSLHIGSMALQEIECSPKIFSEKEWIRFFDCLRDISIYFVRSSGSLKYYIFILPCLESMTERVSIDSLKFKNFD